MNKIGNAIAAVAALATIVGTVYTVASYYKHDDYGLSVEQPKSQSKRDVSPVEDKNITRKQPYQPDVIHKKPQVLNRDVLSNEAKSLKPIGEVINSTQQKQKTKDFATKTWGEEDAIKPIGEVITSNQTNQKTIDFAIKTWEEEDAIKPVRKNGNDN